MITTSKTPIKYWGGKQQLADQIIALIPEHRCYTEVFFGGGAVFFKKPTSKVEIINDLNDNMVNFYRTVKRKFDALHDEVDVTLYSEYQFREAKKLWKEGGEDVLRAWAVFVLSNQSFSSNMDTWAHSDTANLANKFLKTKKMFNELYMKRLEHVQIFCRDALQVLDNTDSSDTFHFIDPPYINTECCHYEGYTESNFKDLLNWLSKCQGRFILTTFPSDILSQYTAENGWNTINHIMPKSASTIAGTMKNEVFTLNFNPTKQGVLF